MRPRSELTADPLGPRRIAKDESRLPGPRVELVGASRVMRRVYALVQRAARTDATVVVTGETGTGKEVVAQALHALSCRRHAALVPLDCASVSPTLIESQLFGHERGSFTGAERQHRGYFERADGGTLFLDEVSEMPVELQAKLLRALETSVIERVGATAPIRVDVRVIAAANRPLADAVTGGKLRADLMYRLNAFPIQLPPLRERGDDVLGLADHFLAELNAAEGTAKRITASGRAWLRRYDWPGNVRELKNAVQRAFILAERSDSLQFPPEGLVEGDPAGAAPASVTVSVGTSVAAAERTLIMATLEAVGGNKRKAAAALEISLKTLYNRLNEYGELVQSAPQPRRFGRARAAPTGA